jgi:S1-C subfamily serine protease
MHRPSLGPLALTLAVAVGGLGAYPFLAPQRAVAAPVPASCAGPAVVSYREAVARAAPSVVTVHSASSTPNPLPFGRTVQVRGVASGVIVAADGHVVTNHHAVKDASKLFVELSDGAVRPARVVGADPESDLALLKIDAEGLRPIAAADIEEVAVGDVVLAVGNPLGIGQTVTQGIISAIVRKGAIPVENFIQTDAAINPGNSGGALIDASGRLVGINTLILSHGGGSEGIGFAIPADFVQKITALLQTKGRVARAWLGLRTAPPIGGEGARVIEVERGGPADRAGIEAGDVITRFGEQHVRYAQDVTAVVIGAEPAERVSIDFLRNGRRATAEVELAPLPSGERAP